ncbi:MAG: acyltransferase family protein [Candidatus Bathyarchaeia archaeon]|jgi:surface polysaccharide O-acyltransferase-like enzyme
MQKVSATKTRIPEFDLLKILALLLIILVHSDMYYVFPDTIHLIQWFLVSSLFFISGFLAFNSFQHRGVSILSFFKSKILLLYIPFVLVSVFYFVLQIMLGLTKPDLMYLLSHVTMINIFDALNSAYNWDFLWFIPYLLLCMFIFCIIEKYVHNPKLQILIATSVWFYNILAWSIDTDLKFGLVFTQYFLVFMAGVWLNKFGTYEKVMNIKTAVVTIPVAAFFVVNLSGLFTCSNTIETVKYLLYYNGRSILFSISTVFLALLVLKKLNISRNRFGELIALSSILIYFMEPFFSYMVRLYIFGQPTIYFANGTEFFIYQIIRVVILFLILPLAVYAIKKIFNRNMSSKKLVTP